MQPWNPPAFDTLSSVGRSETPVKTASPEPARLGTAVSAPPPPPPQALFLRGLQEGLEEGRQQGLAMGREEGFDKGRQDGFQAGFQQGYQSSLEKIESLTTSLQGLVAELSQLPAAIEASLNELVYDTALRLAGKESMDRSVFQRALQDALTQLPRPGESLVMRVPQTDLESWQAVVADGPSRFALVLQADESLEPGHAFVDIHGTRLDIGARARQALVRSALGLLPADHPDAKG